MNNNIFFNIKSVAVIVSAVTFYSCSKESTQNPPADACAGKTITVNATAAASSPCGNTGSITASATGSTGFMFKLNSSGTYQTSGNFTAVAAGTYTVFVKDADGCERSRSITVDASGTPGPLFTAVKNLISSACQTCHNGTRQEGGMNWANQCNIIQFKTRIKVRAVDEGTMPPGGALTTAQKAVITDWINAGGRYDN